MRVCLLEDYVGVGSSTVAWLLENSMPSGWSTKGNGGDKRYIRQFHGS